jgi:hypothetical protein
LRDIFKVMYLFTKIHHYDAQVILIFYKSAVTLPKIIKMFLSISYTNAVILPKFHKIIRIIYIYAVMASVYF